MFQWSLGLFSKINSWRWAQHKTGRPWHSTYNYWFILFYHVGGPCMNRNSLQEHLVEGPVTCDFTLHYTPPVITLNSFGGVVRWPWDTFFWVLTISWSQLLARVWSGPKGPWPLHFKHSHWWKRRSQSKFTSHYGWRTNKVSGCKNLGLSLNTYLGSILRWPLDTFLGHAHIQLLLHLVLSPNMGIQPELMTRDQYCISGKERQLCKNLKLFPSSHVQDSLLLHYSIHHMCRNWK